MSPLHRSGFTGTGGGRRRASGTLLFELRKAGPILVPEEASREIPLCESAAWSVSRCSPTLRMLTWIFISLVFLKILGACNPRDQDYYVIRRSLSHVHAW